MTCMHLPSVQCPDCINSYLKQNPFINHPLNNKGTGQCDHCYCGNGTTKNNKIHSKCCKCGDERFLGVDITW